MLPCIVIDFFLYNQPDALIMQIYSVIKLYMFRASSVPIIRSFPLYIRHCSTAYGLDGPGIESRWGEIFRTCPDRP